jgi:prevent-host-death family protein
MSWQLQEAKAKFSEVVKQARAGEPQFVSVHGQAAVVVLSVRDYEKLSQTDASLVAFLAKSPLAKNAISLARDRDTGRKIRL